MTAGQAVHQAITEIEEQIVKLQSRVESYRDTDCKVVNWGHVGSLNYIRDQLRIANSEEL